MKRLVATLGLVIVAAAGTIGGVAAQEASPVASPGTGDGIPPVVWVSDDFVPLTDTADSEQGAIAPKSSYWIQFLPDGQLSLRADCNGGFGSYELNGSNLTFGPLGTTLMLCPEGGSGDAFLDALSNVSSWSIDQRAASDKLVLGLSDGTSLTFSPSLTGVVWQWSETQISDDTAIIPANPENYYLSFAEDGAVAGQIDCNRAFGSYTTDGPQITLMLATTRMYCGDDSQDALYAGHLAEVSSFVIRDGTLALALPMDGGIVLFEPVVPE
ncbi:MAG: META domain-containing protein [Thermomicrobiales bacterium]|nr:META domain-containing protein [Thermomicrobiales bacterium]